MPNHRRHYLTAGSSDPTNAQVAGRCILAMVAIVVIGTCGFMRCEPTWGVWKAFFFHNDHDFHGRVWRSGDFPHRGTVCCGTLVNRNRDGNVQSKCAGQRCGQLPIGVET